MKRLLLVEDNRMERKIIFHTLQGGLDKKISIDEANEGSIALTYLSNLEYDLVITDLIMPQIEGLELIRIIKREYPTCKIIAISGSKPYYLHMAKKLGVNGIFTKPLDGDRFIKKVTSILELDCS